MTDTKKVTVEHTISSDLKKAAKNGITLSAKSDSSESPPHIFYKGLASLYMWANGISHLPKYPSNHNSNLYSYGQKVDHDVAQKVQFASLIGGAAGATLGLTALPLFAKITPGAFAATRAGGALLGGKVAEQFVDTSAKETEEYKQYQNLKQFDELIALLRNGPQPDGWHDQHIDRVQYAYGQSFSNIRFPETDKISDPYQDSYQKEFYVRYLKLLGQQNAYPEIFEKNQILESLEHFRDYQLGDDRRKSMASQSENEVRYRSPSVKPQTTENIPQGFSFGYGDDSWDMDSYIDKFTTLRETSQDTMSAVQNDIRTTNTQAWSPFSDYISDASSGFSNELSPAADATFKGMDTGFAGMHNSVNEFDGGVTGLNTGFDSVYDTATGLFQQTEQGFSDSLYAIQDYQISGLAPLARGYGSQLPTELGLFQSTHDTAFSQMQGVTNDSYGRMQLAAKGFFDDVGMQANQVLGGLLTGPACYYYIVWIT